MNNAIAFGIGVISSIVAALIVRFAFDKLSLRFSFGRIMTDLRRIHSQMIDDGFTPDLVVTVDRSGTIVGGIWAGFIGLQTAFAIPTLTERLSTGERFTIVPPDRLPRPEAINGKKLLIFNCYNDTGSALEAVYQELTKHPFAPADVKLASLYTTMSPRVKPRYFAAEVGRDLNTSMNKLFFKMPWMAKEWRHALASERSPVVRAAKSIS